MARGKQNDGNKRGDTAPSAYDKKHGQKSGVSGKQRNTPDVPHPRSKSRSDGPIRKDRGGRNGR